MSENKKRGRPAVIIEQPPVPAVIPEGINQCLAEHTEATRTEKEHEAARSQQLARVDARLSLDVPYVYDTFVVLLRALMERAAEAVLDAGRVLLAIKEHEPQGRFLATLEDVGMPERTARRWMQATLKFHGAHMQPLLGLGRSKLYTLMDEDDEQLAELAEGGTIAGLTLSAVQRMTVADLRKALADAEAETAAARRVADSKSTRLIELETALERRAALPQAEQETALVAEIDAAVESACAAATPLIGKLIAAQESRWSERLNAACRHGIERCLTYYLDVARENGIGIDLAAMLDGAIGASVAPGAAPPAAKEPTLTAVK